MFCRKCGKEISGEMKFCTNCGTPTNEDNIKNQAEKIINKAKGINDYEFTSLLKETLKNPIKASTEEVKKLSDSTIMMATGIITFLISLITSIGFVILTQTVFGKLKKQMLLLGGSEKHIEQGILKIKELLPSSFEIFFTTLLGTVVFFGLIILIAFLIFTTLMKKNIPFIKYLSVILIALIIKVPLLIIEIISMFLSFKLFIFIIAFDGIITLTLLFQGIYKLSKEEKTTIYMYPVIHIVSSFVSAYISAQFLVDKFMGSLQSEIIMRFLKDIL